MGYWVTRHEPGRSLVSHRMPEEGHRLTIECWCNPRPTNSMTTLTEVVHSEAAKPRWMASLAG
jgi:hypothetical protein